MGTLNLLHHRYEISLKNSSIQCFIAICFRGILAPICSRTASMRSFDFYLHARIYCIKFETGIKFDGNIDGMAFACNRNHSEEWEKEIKKTASTAREARAPKVKKNSI